MMENYIDKLMRIEPLMSSYLFYNTVQKAKHYWANLKDYKLHENLEIIGDEDSMMIVVSSYHNDRLTKLDLTRSGTCARVSYSPEYGGATLNIFVDSNNKMKALTAYNNEDNQPLIDLFYGSDFVRFFNVVMPSDEVAEILFQYSTASNTDLSFIEGFHEFSKN